MSGECAHRHKMVVADQPSRSYSRGRKVRCVAPKPDALDERCEACAEVNIRCQYKDKERYWAEKRSTSAAGRLRPDSPAAHSVAGTSRRGSVAEAPSHLGRSEYTPSGLVAAAYPEVERYGHPRRRHRAAPYTHASVFSPTTASSSSSGGSGWPSGGSGRSGPWSAATTPSSATWPTAHVVATAGTHGSSAPSYGMAALSNSGGSSPAGQTDRLHPLFDVQSAAYPHAALMPAYLYVFFQTYGRAYTFLNYEESVQKHLSSKLSPLLANVMAAMAAP